MGINNPVYSQLETHKDQVGTALHLTRRKHHGKNTECAAATGYMIAERLKSRGPSKEPCGHPADTECSLDNDGKRGFIQEYSIGLQNCELSWWNVFSFPTTEGEFLSKGCLHSHACRDHYTHKYWGASENFPARKQGNDLCAVTLRWFRTNQR
ncbi:hypothetical protein TNCV_3331021 [Trichonephila clavipes]|nr:hypothetical protein TNCV_3331021 [Trichonephila clavipes]